MDKTVLVVDDIAANRNLLRETLEPRGYEVLLASNGVMALKVAARACPDVILMDVNMPDMDGYEACRRLKETSEQSAIPVIFITANDDTQSLVRGFEAGGVDYITKPFRENEVLMRVETHVKIHTLTQALSDKNSELESEVQLRKAAEEQAIEANEAKTRFLSFISHEMRASLGAIIGFSDELSEVLDGESLSESRDDAVRIHGAAEHLLGLINNLLDLSKIEAGKMPLVVEEVVPATLVEELAKDVRPLVQKNGNRLSVACDSAVEKVQFDATKLRQVLLNLVSNAAKFTNDGEIRMDVSLSHDGAQLQYAVSDTGIGMSDAEMDRLFVAYQQANDSTAKNFGGTGLGLAISREFCRLMGGDLTVQSERGRGSVFTAVLPVMGQPAS